MAKRSEMVSAAVAAFVFLHAAGASAEKIGTVAAVNSLVEGEPPASPPRALTLGNDLSLDERIISSPVGSGQFLFLDQSSLTVAPNSNIVLDKYVYNPESKTGEFAVDMARGTLRFIGGRISKTSDATINTPAATIGIRGGMAIIEVADNGATRVIHIAGEYSKVTTKSGKPLVIARPGGMAEIPPGAVEANWIGIASKVEIEAFMQALAGRGDAGQREQPDDADVIASRISDANSDAKGVASRPPKSTANEEEQDRELTFDWKGPTSTAITTPLIAEAGETIKDPTQETEKPDTEPGPDNGVPGPDGTGGGGGGTDSGAGGGTDSGTGGGTGGGGNTGGGTGGGGNTGGGTGGGGNTDPQPLSGVSGQASLGTETFVFTEVYTDPPAGVTASGDRFLIPATEGEFSFDFNEGESPRGSIAGSGFYNEAANFTYTRYNDNTGAEGTFLTGAVSDPLPEAATSSTDIRSYSVGTDLGSTGAPAFLPGSLGGDFTGDGMSELALITNPGGAATGGSAKAVSTYLQINETRAGQAIGFGVFTSDVGAAGQGTPTLDGGFEGSFSTANGLTRVYTPVRTMEDGAGGSAFGAESNFLALANGRDPAGQTAEPGVETVFGGTSSNFSTFNVASLAGMDSVSEAARASLTDSTLSGYAAVTGYNLESGLPYAGASLSSAGVSLVFNDQLNAVTSTIFVDDFLSLTPNSPDAEKITSLRLDFGGENNMSAMIDDRRFAAREATGGDAAIEGGIGTVTINRYNGALASAELAGDGGIFPAGVTPRSEYLTWGWWAADVEATAEDAFCNPPCVQNEASQRYPLGTFIAGAPVQIADLPTNGSASYSGFAVITALVDGNNVVDGAGFGLEFDFKSRTGTASFTDVLGADARFDVSKDDPTAYSGNQMITIDNRDVLLDIRGDFFSGRNDRTAATGGALRLHGTDGSINGAGIFAGDKINNKP